MRKRELTPEQILQALRQVEGGTTVVEVCRRLGVTEATIRRWKRQYGGAEVGASPELRQLREENRRLRHLVADLTPDGSILRDALGKTD